VSNELAEVVRRFEEPDENIARLERVGAQDRPPKSPRICSFTLSQLHGMPIIERELIVEPFLGRAETIFGYGPKGHGKTWTFMGVALVAAQGGGARFLNFTAPGPGVPVLYLDGEMLSRDILKRADDICRTPGLDPGDNFFVYTPDRQPEGAPPLNLLAEEGRRMVDDHIDDIFRQTGKRIAVLVVDNLRTLTSSWKENDADPIGPVGQWTVQLRSRGISPVLLHHSNKEGGYSGNTAIVTTAHAIIRVQHPKNYRADMGAAFGLVYEWTRAAPMDGLRDFNARLEGNTWTVEEAADGRDQLIRSLLESGKSYREIAGLLLIGKNRVAAAAKRLGLARKGEE
jgi:AAA domain